MEKLALYVLFVIVFCIISAFGLWVTNVVKFVSLDFDTPYRAEIIRGIGIPAAPIGIIVSLMDIGEEND